MADAELESATAGAAEMSGAQQAAVFLLGIGEAAAASVLRHMQPKEVQQVGEAMAHMNNVPPQAFASVASIFSSEVENIDPSGVGVENYTRRVLVEALGETKAKNMFNKVMNKTNSKGLDALRWMDARSVAALLRSEHPQMVAIVLSNLDADQSAEILMLLPEEIRSEIVMRVARLDLVDASALEELDAVLEQQLQGMQKIPPSMINGAATAAGILNLLDSNTEADLMQELKDNDESLGNRISDLMFVFEDLMNVDDRGMQRLLREISNDQLAVALKGVDSNLMEKFLKNMSSRAAEMLQDDIESGGPVKLSDVEFSQKEILSIAGKLSEDGEIMLGGKGGESFV